MKDRAKKKETWFRFPLYEQWISRNYPELRAFFGMYWIYKGELTKKQFRKKYLVKKQRPNFTNIFGREKRKKRLPIQWNDIRIEFDNNNSLFTIHLKSDSGFSAFNAYPVLPGQPIDKSRQVYNRRYLMYKKALQRRAQLFNRNLARNKRNYDQNYRRMQDFAWKDLQLRMCDEEKVMSREDWLQYYDNIIADEKMAVDNSSLINLYIMRGLVLRGYSNNGNNFRPRSDSALNRYAYRSFNADFEDSKTGGKLAVTNIYVLDPKTKVINQSTGTMGLLPNLLTIKQFASFNILVEMRNGNWGRVSSAEIDRQVWEPNKLSRFRTLVFDKNLDTIGDLLKPIEN